MSYDLNGAWDNVTGHNSPLFNRHDEDEKRSLLNIVSTIQNKGLDVMKLYHCGLVTPYGTIWPPKSGSTLAMVMAWRHQVITLTNVNLSLVMFCGIHSRTISHREPKLWDISCVMCVKLYCWNYCHISQGPMSWPDPRQIRGLYW